MSIIGKYFFYSTDDYYTYGKIIEDLGEGFYLANKTGCDRPYDCVYHLAQLTDGNEGTNCQFFSSEIELKDYIEWLEEPSEEPSTKSTVLTLVKKDDNKV
jgi:hypothetical protein